LIEGFQPPPLKSVNHYQEKRIPKRKEQQIKVNLKIKLRSIDGSKNRKTG
jgi:hypothetical protein